MSELDCAKAILRKMLAVDGADIYRAQLEVAELVRHETGCSINVDRDRAEPAPYGGRTKGGVIAEATGHGKLWLMLHVYEGYLDDLELLNHRRFPDPATVRVARR